MTIKEEFMRVMQTRKRAKEERDYIIFAGFDTGDIVNVLSKNYMETKALLQNATKEEIGVAIDALEDLVRTFEKKQAQELIAIFKQKAIEFSDVQQYCDCDYMEQIEVAESYLEELALI